MQIKTKKFSVKTERGPQFIDITDNVADFVNESGVQDGLVSVFSHHTTAAIKINENEPLLITDMEKMLTRIAEKDGEYDHNNFEIRTVNMCEGECANGHSHCQHLLLGTSETIPLLSGRMQFGLWQRIFLVELDHDRERQVTVQIIGQ